MRKQFNVYRRYGLEEKLNLRNVGKVYSGRTRRVVPANEMVDNFLHLLLGRFHNVLEVYVEHELGLTRLVVRINEEVEQEDEHHLRLMMEATGWTSENF